MGWGYEFRATTQPPPPLPHHCANSFVCHTSEKSPPKSFVCRTFSKKNATDSEGLHPQTTTHESRVTNQLRCCYPSAPSPSPIGTRFVHRLTAAVKLPTMRPLGSPVSVSYLEVFHGSQPPRPAPQKHSHRC